MPKTKKPDFNCDVNGSIMVVSALRYALGRHTYVPVAVQDWIKFNWKDLDEKTKCNVVRDVFEHLYESQRESTSLRITTSWQFDLKSWEDFGIEMYGNLSEENKKFIYENMKGSVMITWFDKELYPKL
jgi:hypothetical protein